MCSYIYMAYWVKGLPYYEWLIVGWLMDIRILQILYVYSGQDHVQQYQIIHRNGGRSGGGDKQVYVFWRPLKNYEELCTGRNM